MNLSFLSNSTGESSTDFKKVTHKRAKKNKIIYDSLEYNLRKINSLKEELEGSNYFVELSNTISKSLSQQQGTISEIISYGIGSFSDNIAARYQFALLLLFQQQYNCNVLIYDPIFNKLECEIIEAFKITLITHNEECKRLIKNTSLIYMPRCPTQLINNLLYSNWNPDNLQNIVLLSNSINLVIENKPDRLLKENLSFIFNAKDFIEEVPVENTFRFSDIFNDTSLHYFLANKIKSIANHIWDLKSVEPVYAECDFERTK